MTRTIIAAADGVVICPGPQGTHVLPILTGQHCRTGQDYVVTADQATEADVVAASAVLPQLTDGTVIEQGQLWAWGTTLVIALQDHTVEGWWLSGDDLPASLYRAYQGSAGGYPVWVQPDSTNPYNETWDDGSSPVVVRFPDANGALYVNTHGNGNVWSPADYGWSLYTP